VINLSRAWVAIGATLLVIGFALGRPAPGLDCNGNGIPDEEDIASPPPLDPGVAYWRFEEAIGAVVLDSGPNGLDGSTNGVPVGTDDVAVGSVRLSGAANAQSLLLRTPPPCGDGGAGSCGEGDCCAAHGTPGCGNDACCTAPK